MTHHPSLDHFLKEGIENLSKGPVALVLAEDEVEIASTIRHHLDLGFKQVILFAAHDLARDLALPAKVQRVDQDVRSDLAAVDTINAVINAAPGIWLYYCFNAEYLFFPFCEHRTIGEMLAFHTEERREAMLTYVIDLYAGDLDAYPRAVNLDDAYLDRSGYYALARNDEDSHPRERQLDFHGGLRWRFEEFVPVEKRRIDRIGIFRAKPGLELRVGHTLNDEEMNTYSCPWHHNLTAAICSFRTAKALKRNPSSTFAIQTYKWRNSVRFDWHSQQLLELGLMEPGQWF